MADSGWNGKNLADRGTNKVTRNGSRLRLYSRSGLLIDASTSGADGVLEEFYQDYDRAFVLENEKEGFDGFAECLALNEGKAYIKLANRFGGFREFVLIVREPVTGERLGGACFIGFPLPPSSPSERTVLSLNLNYIFVNAPVRRRGIFKRLVCDMPDLALRLLSTTNLEDIPIQWPTAVTPGLADTPKILMFIEQNDPIRMTRGEYERDTKHTGLDQLARIAMWVRLGAKIVDFPYVQPPLTSKQKADHKLVYGILGADGDTLSACVLGAHLERFFGISVLKGSDLNAEPTAASQLSDLERMCNQRQAINLLTAEGLDRIRLRSNLSTAAEPTSLRLMLREFSQY